MDIEGQRRLHNYQRLVSNLRQNNSIYTIALYVLKDGFNFVLAQVPRTSISYTAFRFLD
jgi:hypothetical protein